MNVAQLKYEIDSSQAKTAEKNLGGMSKAAKDAATAQKGLGSTSTRAGRDITAANTNISRSSGVVTKAYTAMRVAMVAAIVGITAGLIGLTSLMTRFVSSSVEAQKVQAQLAAAIRSTGGAAGQTIASLNAHAAALQKVTNFGDEATNSAQGLLLTFTKIRGDTFPRATTAVLDMATAMGTDLKSAALQVGKALNDPVLGMTALSRSGIQFTESQKEMVKAMVASGDMLGAQTLILKELETQFGGSARAARETLGGALIALGNAWGDLFEMSGAATNGLRLSIESLATAIANPAFAAFMSTVGSVLFGVLQAATLAATGLANAVIFLVDNIDTIGVAAGTAGTLMLIALGPAILASIASGFVAIGVAGVAAFDAITLAIAANPFGALAVGITAAITAAYVFRDEIKKAIGVDVVQIATTAANTLIGSFVAAFEDIKFVWNNFPLIFGAAVTGAVNAVVAGVEMMINASIAGINKLIGALNALPNWVKPESLENIGAVGNVSLDRAANPAAAALSNAMGGRNAAVNEAMSFDYIGSIGNTFRESTPAVTEFAGAVAAANDNLAGSGKEAAKLAESYAKIVEKAEQFIAAQELERQALGMTEQAANAMRYTQELLNHAQQAGIKLTAEQRDELTGLAQKMAATEAETSRLTEALDFAKGAAKGFLSDLRQGLINGEGFWKSFGNAALNVLDKIINKIEDQLVNAMFSASSIGGSSSGGLFGSIFGGIGKLLGFAKGTSYAPGGVAMVGEQGPEIVELPRGSKVNTASETRRMMSGAGQSGSSGSGGAILVEVASSVDESGNITTFVQRVSGQVAGQAIAYASPAIIERSAKAAGQSLGRGDYDSGMANYGVAREARSR